MKLKLLAGFLACASLAQGAVTLGFSTGTNVAEGWTNSAGNKNSTMVWGIVVDANGDGFNGLAGATTSSVDGGLLYTGGATYDGGFVLSSSTSGSLLSVGGAVTDDRIYLSNNLMAVVGGEARISQLQNILYGAGIAAGDKYAIIWFDATALGGTASGSYGMWSREGTDPTNGTILPADPGSYTTAAIGPAGMFGADNTAGTKLASLTLVPEPSAALLGMLGALGLLRRRR